MRAEPFARALGWLETTETGRSVAAVIVGRPGMGKTTFAGAALDAARARGFTVYAGRGHGAGLPSLVATRLAGDMQIGEAAGAEPTALIRAIGQRVHSLVRAERPIALCFEDIHGYHPTDLALVQELALWSPPESTLLLLTSEAGVPGSEQLLAEIENVRGLHRLELGPLTVAEATDLIAETAPFGAVTRRFVRDALELTSGEPLRLIDLLRVIHELPAAMRDQIVSGSRTLQALPLPSEMARARARVYDRLDGERCDLVRALATWGAPGTAEALAYLLEVPMDAAEATAIQLEADGVIRSFDAGGRIAFALADPLAGLALATGIPALERRRMHARAAAFLDLHDGTVGENPTLAARHYLSAMMPLDRRRTDVVLAAARRLIDRSRFATAGELLEALLSRLAGEHVPPDLYVLLAETLARSGSWQDARRMLDRVGGGEVTALLRSARDLVALGRETQALSLYRSMLADESIDAVSRIDAGIDGAWTQHMVGHPQESERSAREAAELAEIIERPDLVASARMTLSAKHLMGAHSTRALMEARIAARSAWRSRNPATVARATSVVGNAIADVRPLNRGLRWLERAHREAEACEDYPTLSGIAVRLATAYLETGKWRAAEQMAASAMHVDASLHRIRSLRRSRAVMSLLHALQGVTDPLDSRLDDTFVGNERFGGPAITIPDLVARFEHQLLTGALEHASVTIEKAHAVLVDTAGWDRSLVLDVLPRMHLVYARLGDDERLRGTLDEFEALGERVEGLRVTEPLLLHGRSRLRAAAGSWHLAHDLAERAAERFHALDYRWRGALARLDAGDYAASAGDRAAAVAAFEAAYRDFDAIGA
ncbi:MAG: hypothetical protein O3B31_06110, partial [Chloroflexi bacterium]|nr:hypothetical protein [Chloroflexota bacterium]